jgi:tRNA pseudouridine55 synthase
MDGIFNVNKPAGWTSHDVVAAVRRWSGERRVGHAGTLDPAASGVLLVCLGRATRLAEYLAASRKAYWAEVTLGATTDTDDAAGKVIATAAVEVTAAQLAEALSEFQGQLQQRPPAYAALKRDGVPFYRLARAGVTVEAAPRPVIIHRLTLLAYRPPAVVLDVECSSGTYVRSLARDLGERLGCGAHLSRLMRRASGRFTLGEAVDLTTLQDSLAQGYWPALLYAPDEALLDYPATILGQASVTRIRQGKALPDLSPHPSPMRGGEEGKICRAYGFDGELIAILRREPEAIAWRPEKVLA